jgi:HNH endonuclease
MSEDFQTCMLCQILKPVSDFSLEHIWPKALGGQKLDETWRIRILCRRCNNECGLHIDGEFLRSFFGKAERHTAHSQINSKQELVYLGPIADISHPEGRTLEYWAFPEYIRIFVSAPNEAFSYQASGDPRKKQKIRVYLETKSINENREKYLLAAVKIVQTFQDARLFFLDVESGDVVPFREGDENGEIEAAQDFEAIMSAYRNMREQGVLKVSISFRASYGNRFLTKTALSLGLKFMGEKFAQSEYAGFLRQATLERDDEKRRKIPLLGSGYFGNIDTQPLVEMFHRLANWTLLLKVTGEALTLSIVTPMKKLLTIVVEPQFPRTHDKYNALKNGLLWFVSAGPGDAEGPIEMHSFLNGRSSFLH